MKPVSSSIAILSMVAGLFMLLIGIDSAIWLGSSTSSLMPVQPTPLLVSMWMGYGLLGVTCGLIIYHVRVLKA